MGASSVVLPSQPGANQCVCTVHGVVGLSFTVLIEVSSNVCNVWDLIHPARADRLIQRCPYKIVRNLSRSVPEERIEVFTRSYLEKTLPPRAANLRVLVPPEKDFNCVFAQELIQQPQALKPNTFWRLRQHGLIFSLLDCSQRSGHQLPCGFVRESGVSRGVACGPQGLSSSSASQGREYQV